MMKLDGKLTISRISGREEERCVRIELVDSGSGCVAAHASLSLEAFASAVLGQGYIPCELEFNDSGKVGMQAENKLVMVPLPEHRPFRDDGWIAEALRPFEVDGWKGRNSDMENHHCFVRTKDGREFQRVVFFRHVQKAAL